MMPQYCRQCGERVQLVIGLAGSSHGEIWIHVEQQSGPKADWHHVEMY